MVCLVTLSVVRYLGCNDGHKNIIQSTSGCEKLFCSSCCKLRFIHPYLITFNVIRNAQMTLELLQI